MLDPKEAKTQIDCWRTTFPSKIADYCYKQEENTLSRILSYSLAEEDLSAFVGLLKNKYKLRVRLGVKAQEELISILLQPVDKDTPTDHYDDCFELIPGYKIVQVPKVDTSIGNIPRVIASQMTQRWLKCPVGNLSSQFYAFTGQQNEVLRFYTITKEQIDVFLQKEIKGIDIYLAMHAPDEVVHPFIFPFTIVVDVLRNGLGTGGASTSSTTAMTGGGGNSNDGGDMFEFSQPCPLACNGTPPPSS